MLHISIIEVVKIKVCHVTSVHKEDDVRITLKEVTTLAESYETILLVNRSSKIKNDQFKIIDLNLNYKNRISRILTSRKKIFKKALEINADLYHFHDPELIPVGNKLKKYGKEVIYDVHEDTVKQILSKHYIPGTLRKTISKAFELYQKKSVENYSAIVTATPHLKIYFKKINPTTIDVNNYPILDEFVNLNNNFHEERKKLVYIGGLSEERGIFTMIQLANHFKNYEFIFCGHFLNPEDEKKAQSLQQHNNISYEGFVSREKVREVLENADLGMVLLEKNERYKESLPIKMFEYMAAGVPVLATNFVLWENILKASGGGEVVNPNKTNEIIRSIDNILSNVESQKMYGEKGKKYVNDKFNWENEGRKLLKLYKNIEENL